MRPLSYPVSAPNPEGPHVHVYAPVKALSLPSSTHAIHTTGPPLGYPAGLRVPTQGGELALGGQARGSRLRKFGWGIQNSQDAECCPDGQVCPPGRHTTSAMDSSPQKSGLSGAI